MTRIHRLCVVGLGYIGLPTAAVFASRKLQVHGVDINQSTVDLVNKGEVHIVEPELDILVRSVVAAGYLRASVTPESADAFIISVPTPLLPNRTCDMSYITSAAVSIAPFLKKGDLVILESTSPVGATEKMAETLARERNDLTFPQHIGEDSDVRVAHCPERVLPGHVIRELVENDRIIGGMTERCSRLAVDLYKVIVKGECLVTSVRTAEMAKLTENSFRDVNIAFANELSILCEQYEIDVWELIGLANRHPRVNILNPGPGVGGHCIAVDPWMLIEHSPDDAKLIKTAREVNDHKPKWVVNRILGYIQELSVKETLGRESISISFFGLSFKADIDDLRESPACQIVQEIIGLHPGKILVVEPYVNKLPEFLRGQNVTKVDAEDALKSNLLVLLVDHYCFRELSVVPGSLQRVVDTRGIWRV